MKHLALLSLLWIAAAGLASAQIANPARVSPYSGPGSIFPSQADGRVTSLTADPIAFAVGDFITIIVNLNTSASLSKQLSTAKTSSVNDSITSLINPNNANIANQWSGAQSFAGGGTQADSEGLTTTIQARIDEALPNGTFHVVATRQMTVGKEKSTMVLTGYVRRQDLAADNSVSSTQVAELAINQTGNGDLSRAERKGWLTTLYEFVSPF
ncbi:MAG: flagellar basal body L-ring protein FlgH [Verrucomicrobium sp.]|nr:flagellar basal body L-ring protein FlgH [Verrucomicrobium sp.]